MDKHGIFLINCFDHPRGYYYELFFLGKYIGYYDYYSDACIDFDIQITKEKRGK